MLCVQDFIVQNMQCAVSKLYCPDLLYMTSHFYYRVKSTLCCLSQLTNLPTRAYTPG